jgi:hypothetical protein
LTIDEKYITIFHKKERHMVSINNPDFQEYHFLTSCYDEGISDIKVYTLFIYKILMDICPPKNFSTNEFHKSILNKYGVEVPPTLIKEIIKDIAKKNRSD